MSVAEEIPQLTERDWLRAERELCKRSLADFIRLAWHVLEPTTPYVHGWHIDAIADHLQAVTEGQINRLLINCPPGMMKSLLVGVFWPMWEWGPRGMKANRYLCASHSESFALRDNLRARRLVFSSWFQQRWPTALQMDQDTKKKFENLHTGWRAATAMASMTGERGDRVILDDPHSVESALSDAERDTTIRVFQETVPTRLNNPERSAIIVIMQRLHERDVSGFILDEALGYEHLMLPMRFEADRRCKTSIFEDPREENDDLLFPERYPLDVVARDEKALGGKSSPAVAGQFQQRPTPRGGLIFETAKIQFVDVKPAKLYNVTRFWDKAGTKDGGCRTAGVLMGHDHDKKYYILDVVKGQWAAPEREEVIKQTAIMDGPKVAVWVEQEPGSGGKESAESTIRNLAGFACQAERPTGDKAVRAEPLACQVRISNVYLVRGEWNQSFMHECQMFPLGRFKDQVDAAGGAFNKVVGEGGVPMLMAMGK